MQRLLKLGFGVILCIEVLLVFFSFLVESTSQAMELVAFSISLAIFTIVGISMFFPRVRVEEIEVAPPVPSQSSPPAGSGSLPVKPAPGQVVIAPPPAVQRPTPVKAAGVFSKIRRKPEIVKLVSSTEDTTVSTLTPVPTIVPMGMIKPPEAGPKEKFPSIVPRKVEQTVLVTPVPKRQTFAPQEEIDYETLVTKAKGMKFSLIGWWPLGWSRVITYPDMPAQFW
ncbi:MAG: hypothetical protein QXG38_04200, partial [Candidatus Hadarchaeales archaeon]